MKDLSLASYGLSTAADGLDTIALDRGGNHLLISPDRIEGPGVTGEDRAAYVEYRRLMSKFAVFVGSLHNRVPPRITNNRRDLFALGGMALRIRRMGRADMREFLRIAGINIHDLLEEHFDSPLLKGALSLDAVLGSFSGPRSNNTVFTALHRMSGNNEGPAGSLSVPVGGMGAVSDALAAAATGAGAEIRTGSPVKQILSEGLNVSGVELENGERIRTGVVVSNADPKKTILDLLGERHVEAEYAQRFDHLRSRGNAAKLHLALEGLPEFTGLSRDQSGQRLVVAPSPEYVDRAFNHCKYGEYSGRPALEITIPTIHDSTLAPDGRHMLSAVVQYAPYTLKGGWAGAREGFYESVMDMLSEYAPDIREKTVASELLTPPDLEQTFGATGGHWHHGELSLDQFLMLRPVPGAAQYQMPIDGLYLCSAGCHPGGGVMGSAGRNAAHAVLAGDRGGQA